MRNVISTINLAAPYPDYPAILAGVPTLVPEDDPWIKQMLEGGMLTFADSDVPAPDGPWDASLPAPTVAQSDIPPATPGTAPDSPDVASPNANVTQGAKPDESWRVDDLRAYADERQLDVPARATKAELLEAIDAAAG